MDDDSRRCRGANQLLGDERASSPEIVVERLVAIQAQDLRAARLAIRARSVGLTAADVDAAIGDSLVIGWLMRGTLHLVTRTDYEWLHPIFAPRLIRPALRGLERLGVANPDPLVAAVAGALPSTRAEIAALTGLSGQAVPYLIALAAHRGHLVAVGEHTYARAGLDGPTVESGPAQLARRYLRSHAPATPADFAAWSGLPLGTARAALNENQNQVTVTSFLPARLLGPFDPWLLGWKDRSFAVPEALRKRVHPGGGMLRATATVDGVVTGTWTIPKGVPILDPPDARLTAEADDVRRFVTPAASRDARERDGPRVG